MNQAINTIMMSYTRILMFYLHFDSLDVNAGLCTNNPYPYNPIKLCQKLYKIIHK